MSDEEIRLAILKKTRRFYLVRHCRPVPPIEKETTIKVLKNYFDGYAFRDIYLNQSSQENSYGGKSIDIFSRLDDIGSSDYESTFDFYSDIVKLVSSLHCAHTSFVMPCMTPFEYLLPIYFEIEQDPSGGPNRAIVKSLIDNYTQFGISESLIGSEVLHVNLDGSSTFTDASPTAEQAIKIWADEYEQISRNPYARWQYSQSRSFYQRGVRYYPKPESNTIYIQYKTDSGTSVVDIPFLVYAHADVTDLEKLCQVNKAYNTKSETNYNSNQNTQNISRNKAPVNITSPNNNKQLAKRLKDLMKKNEKETLIKQKDRIDPLWRERQKKISEITKEFQLKNTSMGKRTVDLDYGLDTIQKRRIETLKKLSLNAKLNRKSSLNGKFKGNNSKRVNNVDIDVVFVSDDASLVAFHLPEYELGVIYITTFAPEDISDFQSNFVDIVKLLSKSTGRFYSKKLLIDLRYNGGGYGRLSPILTRFLFPHVDSPIWEPMDLPKSNIGKIFTQISDFYINNYGYDGHEVQLDEVTGQIIYDYYQQEGLQRTNKHTDEEGIKSSITVDLTKRATFYAGHVDELRQIASD
ncbi:MAG: hypothetical protein EZS28_008706 [Streblomastix strix]|uniref:Tail specific protease domain-containing protein n=1 Tax=Streblomastix strix TaxID=222440 RepID=A0A5J4WLF0_9EUKA|nr:MAG: hypothetical protein EZS28_008706 [Streblomastix strix]